MRLSRRLFRYPGLRSLLLAQVPADFADWLDFVAIGVLLGFVWQAEPVVFAWLGMAVAIPYLMIGPVAGALADRWNLRWVLIVSNLGRAAATLGLAFVGSVPALLAVVFLRASVDAFFGPAKQATIQAIVPESDRMAANGLSHAINQASKVLGPSVGGALLIGLEPQTVFLANVGVSVLAALILLTLPRSLRPETAETGRTTSTLLGDVRDGLVEVRTKPVVAVSLALMAAAFFTLFLYDRLIALLVGAYGFEQQVYGWAIAAAGAGGVGGALGVGALGRSVGGFILVAVGCLWSGILVIALGAGVLLGLSVPAEVIIALFAGAGVTTAMIMVPFRTLLQQHVDPARIARVFAVNEALNMTAMLAAPFLGTLIARQAGVGAPFVVGGTIMIGLAVAAAVAGRVFAHRPP